MKSHSLKTAKRVHTPGASLLRNRAEKRAKDEHDDRALLGRHLILKEVLRCLEHARGPANGVGNEVLLDKLLDGYRLVLIRTPLNGKCSISLSPRELEISRMIAKGHPNKMIAAVLEISTWTVGTHLRRIFAKLRVTSRAAMVARLAEMWITDSPPRPAQAQSREIPRLPSHSAIAIQH